MAREHLPIPVEQVVLDDAVRLSLVEFCRVSGISVDHVVELVEEGIVHPEGGRPLEWRFGVADVRRYRTASRLQRDLGVNLAGAALALDLLEELASLRRRFEREAPFGWSVDRFSTEP